MIHVFDNNRFHSGSKAYCRGNDRYELVIHKDGTMHLEHGFEPVAKLSSDWKPCNDSFVIEVYKLIDSYL